MSEPFHIVEGTARDQEAIISVRPQIEEEIEKIHGKFDHTDLEWNRFNEGEREGTFYYKLFFYR